MMKLDGVTLDGYENALTGIGTIARDKTRSADVTVQLLTGYQAEARWRGSDLGGRLVDIVPDEMTREWVELSIQPGEADQERADEAPPLLPAPAPLRKPKPLPEQDDTGTQAAEALLGRLDELGVRDAFNLALKYERAYGGAAILLGTDDAAGETYGEALVRQDADGKLVTGRLDADDPHNLTAPLDERSLGSIRHLTVFRGGWDGEVIAWSYYSDPRSPKYGQPRIYMVRNLGVPLTSIPAPGESLSRPLTPPSYGYNTSTIFYVHESRLLVFPGQATSRWARVQMRGWGDSIFTRCDETLAQFNQTWGGVAILMSEYSQGVLKLEGLAELLAAGKEEAVTKRAMMLAMGQSIARVRLLDATEEFKRETISLGSVPEILEQFAFRLAAAAGLPVSILMGDEPKGLNATGNSTVRFFYDQIAARQERDMLPQLRRLVRLLMLCADSPTGGVEPEQWSLEARPLWQETPTEIAARRKVIAETDAIYIDKGAVTPEEVAATRFGAADFNEGGVVIDLEGRQQQVELDEHDAEERKARAASLLQSPPAPTSQPDPDEAPEAEDEPGTVP